VARDATADFDRWLSGVPGGEVWRTHFETRAALDAVAPNVNGPLADGERETIARVLDVYDRGVERQDLRSITRTASFRASHAALQELALPTDERLVRQLSHSGRALHQSLGNFSTGATWQRFLALPDEIVAAADRPPSMEPRDWQFDTEQLETILEHYDRVTRNREYRPIADLPAFQATHERLATLVSQQATANAPPEPLPPPVE
jgi:hypothetical protein